MKEKKISEGKTKKIFSTTKEEQLILYFKDDYVLKSGKKLAIKNKGKNNGLVSAYLLNYLKSYNVATHFIDQVTERETLVEKLDMLPLEVLVRNFAAGILAERYKVKEGTELECPIIEHYLKHEENEDSMINEDHLISFGYASSDEIKEIHRLSSKINAILRDFFRRRNYHLIDFRIEYGRHNDRIILGDEISMDTFRIWDLTTDTYLDLERFKRNREKMAEIIDEIKSRLLMETS